jgi:hypothetical protein
MQRLLSLLQTDWLGPWAPEGRAGRLLVCAFLVEAETLAVNFEETFSRFPVLPFAAHAFAEDARVEFAVTRFANAIQNTIGFRRQLRTQTLFEIRRNVTGQAQHVDERSTPRPLPSLASTKRNVCRETGNYGRDADADSDSRGGERFHRVKSRFGKRRVRLDCPRRFNVRERNREEHAETRIARQILKHVDVSANQR